MPDRETLRVDGRTGNQQSIQRAGVDHVNDVVKRGQALTKD